MLINSPTPTDIAFLGRNSVLDGFKKVLTTLEPPSGVLRAQMRSSLELTTMILYTSGNPKNIAFAETLLRDIKMSITEQYLRDLIVALSDVSDRPMATENGVPGRLRTLVNFVRANTPQK